VRLINETEDFWTFGCEGACCSVRVVTKPRFSQRLRYQREAERAKRVPGSTKVSFYFGRGGSR